MILVKEGGSFPPFPVGGVGGWVGAAAGGGRCWFSRGGGLRRSSWCADGDSLFRGEKEGVGGGGGGLGRGGGGGGGVVFFFQAAGEGPGGGSVCVGVARGRGGAAGGAGGAGWRVGAVGFTEQQGRRKERGNVGVAGWGGRCWPGGGVACLPG